MCPMLDCALAVLEIEGQYWLVIPPHRCELYIGGVHSSNLDGVQTSHPKE